MGSGVLVARVAALLLVVAVLGLPIDDLVAYALLLAAVLLVLTGTLSADRRRSIAAVALAAAVVAGHVLWPAPRIEEGHNVFLPGPEAAQTSGLPADVLRVLAQQFDQRYPPEKRCGDPAKGCWRPDRTAEADGYAFSADGVFDRGAYSRRVAGIDFSDPVYLRLGVINELTYAWPDNSSDITRFARDRRSLNLFDRYRITLPLFVVYRFPAPFAGSRLCWRGTVLWETGGERFDELTTTDTQCRDITADDIGRRIFGISDRIGRPPRDDARPDPDDPVAPRPGVGPHPRRRDRDRHPPGAHRAAPPRAAGDADRADFAGHRLHRCAVHRRIPAARFRRRRPDL